MTSKTLAGVPVIDPDDIGHNDTDNPRFNDLIAARVVSRRKLFGLGFGTAGTALLTACGGGDDTPAPAPAPTPTPTPTPTPAPAPA